MTDPTSAEKYLERVGPIEPYNVNPYKGIPAQEATLGPFVPEGREFLPLDLRNIRTNVRGSTAAPDFRISDKDMPTVTANADNMPERTLDIYSGLGFDPETDYSKSGALRSALEERRDLYRDVLGSGEDQAKYQKAQTLFDIAGAAANFAAGRGAQGEDVRGLSPAAQAAAAFSGVPGRVGARLAEERKAQRAIDLAALESAEKEETARKGMVAGERGTVMQAFKEKNLAGFMAGLRRDEFKSDQAFKAAVANADMRFRSLLSDQRYRQDLEAQLTRGEINDILSFNASALADTRASREAIRNVGITKDILEDRFKLQELQRVANQDFEAGQTQAAQKMVAHFRNKGIELQIAGNVADLDAQTWRQELAEDSLLYRQLSDTYDRAFDIEKLGFAEKMKAEDRDSLERLAELEMIETISLGQLNATQELQKDLLSREFELLLKKEDWTRLDRQFDLAREQWSKEYGLDVRELDLKVLKENQRGLEFLLGLDSDRGRFSGDSESQIMLNIASDDRLLDRYATGKLDQRSTNEIENAIRYFGMPRRSVDPQTGNTTVIPGVIPDPLQRAITQRKGSDLSVPDYTREFTDGTLE